MKWLKRIVCILMAAASLCLLATIPAVAAGGKSEVVSGEVEVAGALPTVVHEESTVPMGTIDWLTLGIVLLVVLLVLTAVTISIRESVRTYRENRNG